jgi:pyruvate ferredoxin oxidoreductase alpha subunit
VDIPEVEEVRRFLPGFKPAVALDPENPVTMGAFADPGYYMEFRREQQEAMERALELIPKVGREFGRRFGRGYGLLETVNMDGADTAIVTMGSLAGTVKEFLESKDGVGLVKVRVYRPFPFRELHEALRGVSRVVVVEKNVSIGYGEGALCTELKSMFYGRDDKPQVTGFVAGLGGRDVRPEDFDWMLERAEESPDQVHWVGLK